MKIVYSLPHPAHTLKSEQAGHIVRANAILGALERLGHEIVRLEAASDQSTQAAVSAYRGVVKKLLPRPIAMRLRDAARIRHGKGYGGRLLETIQATRPDLIVETHIAFSLAGKLASEQSGVPLMLDDVAPAWEEEKEYGVGLRKTARDIHREVTGRASLLVAVNKTLRQYLIDEGQPPEKIITVENGIDDRLFHPDVDGSALRAQLGLPADEVVIVFVGSFQQYHRVDLLVRAFARLAPTCKARLLLVGQGQTTAENRALAQSLGVLDRVTFTGAVPYDLVPRHLAVGDIAIMPATNEYGNPMKVYEYMAMGKVVVAPDMPTITEIATHDRDSYLFARENVEAMAAALTRLVEDRGLRERLGSEGVRTAAQHTWLRRGQTIQEALFARGIGSPKK